MTTNRSVLRTKKAIRQAFIELLSEKKSIEKITIIELTDKANIVRSTFYSHYDDIYAVAKEIQKEIANALSETLTNYVQENNDDLSIPITIMIEFFKEREHEYRMLLTSGYNENQFVEQLKDTFAKEMAEKFPFKKSEFFNKDKAFEARFYSEMVIDLVCGYLRGTVKMSLYEIREFTLKVIERLG